MVDDRDAGAGAPLGEEPEYRGVPVEVLRRFARDQSELTSIRQVAAEVGLGRTTLHKFIAGETTPHPRIRRLLGLWYLRRRDPVADEATVRPYRSALEVLLAGLPDDARPRATADVLEVLERGFGPERPAWLDALRPRPADED